MAKIGLFWGSTTEMTSIAGEGILTEMQSLGHEVDSFDVGRSGLDPIP